MGELYDLGIYLNKTFKGTKTSKTHYDERSQNSAYLECGVLTGGQEGASEVPKGYSILI